MQRPLKTLRKGCSTSSLKTVTILSDIANLLLSENEDSLCPTRVIPSNQHFLFRNWHELDSTLTRPYFTWRNTFNPPVTPRSTDTNRASDPLLQRVDLPPFSMCHPRLDLIAVHYPHPQIIYGTPFIFSHDPEARHVPNSIYYAFYARPSEKRHPNSGILALNHNLVVMGRRSRSRNYYLLRSGRSRIYWGSRVLYDVCNLVLCSWSKWLLARRSLWTWMKQSSAICQDVVSIRRILKFMGTNFEVQLIKLISAKFFSLKLMSIEHQLPLP